MDPATWVLFGVVTVIALNQLFSRIPVLHTTKTGFFAVQGVNLIVTVGILLWGVPGYEDLVAVKWVLALLLFWHTVQNNQTYAAAKIQRRRDAREQAKRTIASSLSASRAEAMEE